MSRTSTMATRASPMGAKKRPSLMMDDRNPSNPHSVSEGVSGVRLLKQSAVGAQSGSASQVDVEHISRIGDGTLLDEVNEAGHGLALVHRVGDHALEARGQF